MKEHIENMTGLTALGLQVAETVGTGATELDRKMAFNYILGVAIGALSAKFPDPEKMEAVTDRSRIKSGMTPPEEDRPKRKYTRRAKENPPGPLKVKGEKKHGGWPKGKKRVRKPVSAAEADAAIRKMERDEKAKLTGAGQ